jgi:hypothetical protein
LIPIENRDDLNQDKIDKVFQNLLQPKELTNVPWKSDKMNVLIPMAGAGTRFATAGYTFPKPLIEVDGKAHDSGGCRELEHIEANYTFIVQKRTL